MKTIEIYFESVLVKEIEVSKDSKCEIIDFGYSEKTLVVDKKSIAQIPSTYLVIFND